MHQKDAKTQAHPPPKEAPMPTTAEETRKEPDQEPKKQYPFLRSILDYFLNLSPAIIGLVVLLSILFCVSYTRLFFTLVEGALEHTAPASAPLTCPHCKQTLLGVITLFPEEETSSPP